MECLIVGSLEPFRVEHQVLVMINMELTDGKKSSFLQHHQEVKNRGHELSKVVKIEENSHMVAKEWAPRR